MNEMSALSEFNSFAISSFNTENDEFTKKNQLIRYHYTSAGTLKSILSDSPTLWFTDNRFMNDHTEMVYCVKSLIGFLLKNPSDYPFCQEVVNELLLKNHTAQEYLDLTVSRVEFTDNHVFPYTPLRCFLFCMSTDGDSLPMWNYYVHNGKYEGYNIGFDVYNFLKSFDTESRNTADPVTFYYGKVLYNERDQFRELKSVADFIEKNRRRLGSYAVPHNMVFLRQYIESHGLFFKHAAFQAEKEFRIVLSLTDNRVSASRENYYNENLKKMKPGFYERNGVLVPYMAIPINKNAVKQITISPIIEKSIAEQSMNEFLQINGYNASVVTSNIPIRF